MVIYKTVNTINNKIYVGQDVHDNPAYYGSGKYLKNAIKKYGKTNFLKIILEYCSTMEMLNEREQYWINFLDATNKKIGYNLLSGGQGDGRKSTGLPSETKKLISDSLKIYFSNNPEAKQKLSDRAKLNNQGADNPMYGQGHKLKGEKNGRFGGKGTTEDTRQKISKSKIGSTMSEENKQKMSSRVSGSSNPMFGKSAYDVWVIKYGVDEADRRKGRKASDETREKQRKAAKAREARKREVYMTQKSD